jgi:hypothetical protein
MKRIALGIITASLLIMGYAIPVLATALPDSTPTVSNIYIYRNCLETGDFFMMVDENTPYAVIPTDYTYPQAYVWRLIDTDGSTEIAQALGYVYNHSGYGYNLISFYLSAAQVTTAGITWGDNLFVRLSGTPVAFTSPPIYNFNVEVGNYSSLTDSGDVETAISAQVLAFASAFDSRWGLSGTTSLLTDSETGTALSLYGQAFFRGAIYGVQSLAPSSISPYH